MENPLANCKWETDYDKKNLVMTHTFGDRVHVVADLKTCIVRVFKDGINIREADIDISARSYTRFLSSVAEDAEKLNQFTNQ